MNLVAEKIPFNPRKGRVPSSIEYELGTNIFNLLKEAGLSVFVSNPKINPKSLSIRLSRIGKDEIEFSIQKEISQGEKGYRVYRIK